MTRLHSPSLHWICALSVGLLAGCQQGLGGSSDEGASPTGEKSASTSARADPKHGAAEAPASTPKSRDGAPSPADTGGSGARAEPDKAPHEAAPQDAGSEPAQAGKAAPAPRDPFPDVDLAYLEMPRVALSEAHRAACRVGVDDAFPEASLPDLDGQPRALSGLRGERLTVVFFWSTKNPYALAQLSDMVRDVAGKFESAGVRVVGINVGDTAEAIRAVAEKDKPNFPLLLDGEGTLLPQVATGGLPRTYLLDKSGKILWFDTEYSRTTRRNLQQAILFVLRKS